MLNKTVNNSARLNVNEIERNSGARSGQFFGKLAGQLVARFPGSAATCEAH